jgi:hypothetical protein
MLPHKVRPGAVRAFLLWPRDGPAGPRRTPVMSDGPTWLAPCGFAVDSGVKPILLSATMKTALILVVGKRVGKAV